MSLTECQRTATFGLVSPSQPKKTVNFTLEHQQQQLPRDKPSSSLANGGKVEQCLPINFFHSPAEYNKMLIRCISPETDSFVEKKMGIVRNLEFVNEPLFERQREKKAERITKYTKQLKKETGKRPHSAVQSCNCCCCDQFCWECAQSSTAHQIASLKEQSVKKQDFLIDVEAIKRGEKPRPKSKKVNKTIEVSIPKGIDGAHFCCLKKGSSKLGIDRLINQSLLREVEFKREKELLKLAAKERVKMTEVFSQSVRTFNRTHSAPKPAPKISNPTKQELRQQYWNSVKDLVSFELKKDRMQGSRVKKEEEKESPKRQFKLSAEQMHARRILNGQEAMRIERMGKFQKMKMEKLKIKKLIALADEQAEIIAKNQKKKFKPNKDTVENAFKAIE